MPGAGVGKCVAHNLRCARTTRCGRCGQQAPDDAWPRHFHAPSFGQRTYGQMDVGEQRGAQDDALGRCCGHTAWL
jgi:hypothetical protein